MSLIPATLQPILCLLSDCSLNAVPFTHVQSLAHRLIWITQPLFGTVSDCVRIERIR